MKSGRDIGQFSPISVPGGTPDLALLAGVQRFRALEQDPAGGDVLVAAARAVAAMGMGEGGRGDQQRASARLDLALLVVELGLAGLEALVEICRPQQRAVQGL